MSCIKGQKNSFRDKHDQSRAGYRALIIISEISVGGIQVRPGGHLSTRYTFHSPANELLRARLHVPTILSMNKSEEKNNE